VRQRARPGRAATACGAAGFAAAQAPTGRPSAKTTHASGSWRVVRLEGTSSFVPPNGLDPNGKAGHVILDGRDDALRLRRGPTGAGTSARRPRRRRGGRGARWAGLATRGSEGQSRGAVDRGRRIAAAVEAVFPLRLRTSRGRDGTGSGRGDNAGQNGRPGVRPSRFPPGGVPLGRILLNPGTTARRVVRPGDQQGAGTPNPYFSPRTGDHADSLGAKKPRKSSRRTSDGTRSESPAPMSPGRDNGFAIGRGRAKGPTADTGPPRGPICPAEASTQSARGAGRAAGVRRRPPETKLALGRAGKG